MIDNQTKKKKKKREISPAGWDQNKSTKALDTIDLLIVPGDLLPLAPGVLGVLSVLAAASSVPLGGVILDPTWMAPQDPSRPNDFQGSSVEKT